MHDVARVGAVPDVWRIRVITDIIIYLYCIQELIAYCINTIIRPGTAIHFTRSRIAHCGNVASDVEVIQDLCGYPLYVDGGASGWGDVIPLSNATPEVKNCVALRIAMEVVPKEGNITGYAVCQPGALRVEAVKEAMMAVRGDVRVYIVTGVIGEEGVLSEIWLRCRDIRHSVGILRVGEPAETLAEVRSAALRLTGL